MDIYKFDNPNGQNKIVNGVGKYRFVVNHKNKVALVLGDRYPQIPYDRLDNGRMMISDHTPEELRKLMSDKRGKKIALIDTDLGSLKYYGTLNEYDIPAGPIEVPRPKSNIVHRRALMAGHGYEYDPPLNRNEGWAIVTGVYRYPNQFWTCITYKNKGIICERNGRLFYPYNSKSSGNGYTREKLGSGKYTTDTFVHKIGGAGWFEEIPKRDVTKYVPRSVLKSMGFLLR